MIQFGFTSYSFKRRGDMGIVPGLHGIQGLHQTSNFLRVYPRLSTCFAQMRPTV